MDEILGIFAVVTYQVAQLYVVECREPLWRLQSGKHALGGKAIEVAATEPVTSGSLAGPNTTHECQRSTEPDRSTIDRH